MFAYELYIFENIMEYKKGLLEEELPNNIDESGNQSMGQSKLVENNGLDRSQEQQKIELSFLQRVQQLFQDSKDVIKYTWIDYFNHIFWPNAISIREKKPFVDSCIDKITKKMDVVYLLNKLIEIEKLKNIIFDTNQLNLFDYIPKQNVHLKKLTDSDSNPQIKKIKKTIGGGGDLIKTKSRMQKRSDGQKSLIIIYHKQRKSKIDQKLLSIVDPSLDANKLDSSKQFNNIILSSQVDNSQLFMSQQEKTTGRITINQDGIPMGNREKPPSIQNQISSVFSHKNEHKQSQKDETDQGFLTVDRQKSNISLSQPNDQDTSNQICCEQNRLSNLNQSFGASHREDSQNKRAPSFLKTDVSDKKTKSRINLVKNQEFFFEKLAQKFAKRQDRSKKQQGSEDISIFEMNSE